MSRTVGSSPQNREGSRGRPRRSRSTKPQGAPKPELRILERQVLRGPNYWMYQPAIRLVVDLGGLEQWPTNLLPGFTDALLDILPGLQEHSCSLSRPGGFVERLREGTWLGHVAEHVALQLQQETGAHVTRGKTRGAAREGHYNVIYAYSDEQVGLEAGTLAVRLVNHLIEPEPDFDVLDGVERLILLAERVAFGPSTQAIIDEAMSRDIPYIRLNDHSLIQLGQGKYQKRIRATMTSQTPALAVDIAQDKKLTTRLLASAGLPVPKSEVAATPEEALSVATKLGFPVVVKPLDGNHGRGVSLNLRQREAVEAAFGVAAEESRSGQVIVEKFIEGRDYRVLVVGGRMAAVAERVPAHVVGDGRHTVAELIEQTNRDPRRGIGHEKVLTRIRLDRQAEEQLREQNLKLEDVPPQGAFVRLAATGNMSTGGIAIDRTFEAHEDNVDIAEEAAQVVGLDVAGIDFLAPDIARPVRETGGAIVEVNAAPGFRMHTHPTRGEPQDVAKPVLDLLFPPGSPARIPIVAVTGSNGKTTTVRMIAHIMAGRGNKVGLTSTDGIYIDRRLVGRFDASGPRSAQMVLQNPRVDLAVFEVARGGILREGLGYSANDVAVVLNVTGDHLGLHEIKTLHELAAVKRVVVEAVPRTGYAVLNADDENVLEMRRWCSGSVILFSLKPPDRFLNNWIAAGRKAVVLQSGPDGEAIVLREGRRTTQLALVDGIPATFSGRARMNVQNALAAAGAAHAAGASTGDIRAGLRTFFPSFYEAPGRLNFTELNGVRVLLDYAHNPHGMELLGDFVDRLMSDEPDASHHRIGVIAMPGDRRDDDLREMGSVAARYFDRIIIREDAKTRGRPRGETAAIISDGARQATGGRAQAVEAIPDELQALDRALGSAEPGDLVVFCADVPAAIWQELESRRQQASSA